MSASRILRRATVLTAAAALALSVAPTVPHRAAPRLVSASQPTNAGKIYRWGDSQWHYDFIGPIKRAWSINHRGQVDDQHGMLTINATADPHNVGATLTGHARRYGRWEARVRAEQYTRAHTPYRVVAELIPASAQAYHCGANSIVLASYPLGAHRARMHVRTAPNNDFSYGKLRDLSAGPFHTYAVEVTRSHISWFVDAHVVMTERRAAARSGLMYSVRFRMVATKGRRMNPGRMQMDWVRYYTLARRNARSIDAPPAHRGTFDGAC
jgi:hypothetical protein